MKVEELARVSNAFNRLKNHHWVMSGNLAGRMHAYYSGMKFPKPREYNFVVSNKNIFSNKLLQLGYNLNTTKSSRKFSTFTKRNERPIVIRSTVNRPKSVTYTKYRIHSLPELVKSNPNKFKKILETRKSIERLVFEKLNPNIN